MDPTAMDGTYADYVKHEEEVQLGQEPNALADHTDTEQGSPSQPCDPAALLDQHETTIRRVKGVIKDLIDAGNMYWAKELLIALDLDSGD